MDNEEVTVNAGSKGDLVMLSSQLSDYLNCGERLDDICLWDFVAQTTKVSVATATSLFPSDDNVKLDHIDLDACRARNLQYMSFLASYPEHGRKVLKVMRKTDWHVPVPIGP